MLQAQRTGAQPAEGRIPCRALVLENLPSEQPSTAIVFWRPCARPRTLVGLRSRHTGAQAAATRLVHARPAAARPRDAAGQWRGAGCLAAGRLRLAAAGDGGAAPARRNEGALWWQHQGAHPCNQRRSTLAHQERRRSVLPGEALQRAGAVAARRTGGNRRQGPASCCLAARRALTYPPSSRRSYRVLHAPGGAGERLQARDRRPPAHPRPGGRLRCGAG